jgi:hypothetical protein
MHSPTHVQVRMQELADLHAPVSMHMLSHMYTRDSSDPAALSQAWKLYVEWQLKA